MQTRIASYLRHAETACLNTVVQRLLGTCDSLLRANAATELIAHIKLCASDAFSFATFTFS